MIRRARHVVIVALAAMSVSIAFAVQQITGMRGFENRVEGSNARFNAAFDWRLVAVHKAIGQFGPNADLQVRFFLPDNAPTDVAIQAAELVDFKHYLMQAKATLTWRPGAWNTFAPWPTRDVIDPLQIRADNLAVLASYKDGSGTVYAPVDVRAAGPLQVGHHGYTLYFETARDIQTLTVTVRDESRRAEAIPPISLTCNRLANPNCRLYPAMTTQAVDLPMDSLPNGKYQVIFRATVPRSRDPLSMEVWLYHARVAA